MRKFEWDLINTFGFLIVGIRRGGELPQSQTYCIFTMGDLRRKGFLSDLCRSEPFSGHVDAHFK